MDSLDLELDFKWLVLSLSAVLIDGQEMGADGVDINLGCPQRRAREGRPLALVVRWSSCESHSRMVPHPVNSIVGLARRCMVASQLFVHGHIRAHTRRYIYIYYTSNSNSMFWATEGPGMLVPDSHVERRPCAHPALGVGTEPGWPTMRPPGR